mmetsp:Transcript_72389/g.116728  ORF Transcript_72389/g.116728 Transcript_72389/m.116728 type:complete len:298 (+) Transcript_72389:590-1483(+)
MSTDCAAKPPSLQPVEHGELEATIIRQAQRIPNRGKEPCVDNLPHCQQAHGGVQRMVLELRIRRIPGEGLQAHHLCMICITLAPSIWSATTNVCDSALVAVLQVGAALALLRREVLTPSDDGSSIDVSLGMGAHRQRAKVGPQGLFELQQPPLAGSGWKLNLLVTFSLLAMFARAQASLHAGHLRLMFALEIGHQVDLKVLWPQLRPDTRTHLRQRKLVEVLDPRLRHSWVRVHHPHEPVHGALFQGLLDCIGLSLVGLLGAHEGWNFPARLLEQEVQQLQASHQAALGVGEAGIDV